MIRILAPIALASLIGALAGCTDSEPDLPRLEFPASMPAELAIGDTTDPLVMVRYFANAQGREGKTDTYEGFTFVSSDSTVVQVVAMRRLLGLKAGQADISATDNNGAETKSPHKLTVKP